MPDPAQIESAIAALESQRALLGDDVVDAALAALRDRSQVVGEGTRQERPSLRQVTILFTDVVESTRLGSQLDAEEMHEVIDTALERFKEIVIAQGGHVLQYAGDSMLAAFGTESALEDDAERAIRAGLAISAAATAHGESVRTRWSSVGFAVRVGIHTGTVLLGQGVDAAHMVRGPAVSIAARMEQTATPGGVRISHATHSLVRGIFEVTEAPPVRVKDHEEPVRGYFVHRMRPRAFRTIAPEFEGVPVKMIGREVELGQLQGAYAKLLGAAAASVVTVSAEAGLGKSRLLREFHDWLGSRPELCHQFQGRAFAEGQRQPYSLLRTMLAWHWDIQDDASGAGAKEKIENAVMPLFAHEGEASEGESQAHVLARLIGLDMSESPHVRGIREDGRQIRNRGFHAATQFFQRLAARDGIPIVMLLEDLHWADEGSLDFLTYLLQVSRELPLLMIVTTRPSFFERRPDWPGDRRATTVHLEPLDEGLSRNLAGELLMGLGDVPPALRQLISASAEGNPFYMEELVKMLIAEQVIDTRSRPWRFAPDRLQSLSVPPTLVGVLQSRLDKLGGDEKRAMQQASVMGVLFWENGLAAIDDRSLKALPATTQKGLVHLRGPSLAEHGRAYAFAHQILHRVTYETVLKPSRRLYHARVADWLASLTGAWAKEHAGTIAEHYERAGELLQAARHLVVAAEDAVSRAAGDVAVGHATHGLQLLRRLESGTDINLEWRMHVCLERMATHQGLAAERSASLDAMECIARAQGNQSNMAYVTMRRSERAMRRGDYALAQSLAEDAVRLAESAGDLAEKLRGKTRVAANLHYRGDSEKAVALASEALTEAQAAGLKQLASNAFNIISVASTQTDPLRAAAADTAALALCRETGDWSGATVATCNLAGGLILMGRLPEAELRAREALRLAKSTGDREIQPYALLHLAIIAWRKGNDVQTMAFARQAMEIAIAMSDRLKESGALFWLGNAQLALGDVVAARTSLETAWNIGTEIRHSQRFDAAAGLARIELQAGHLQHAADLVEPILEHLEQGGTLNGADVPRLIMLTCIDVMERTDGDRCDRLLAATHSELMTQADKFREPGDRTAFLDLAEHQGIVALWERRSAHTTQIDRLR